MWQMFPGDPVRDELFWQASSNLSYSIAAYILSLEASKHILPGSKNSLWWVERNGLWYLDESFQALGKMMTGPEFLRPFREAYDHYLTTSDELAALRGPSFSSKEQYIKLTVLEQRWRNLRKLLDGFMTFIDYALPVEDDPVIQDEILETLAKIFPEPDVLPWVQKLLGSNVTANKKQKFAVFLAGVGANGKSTLTNLLSAALGSFTGIMSSDTLVKEMPGGGKPWPDLANCANCRLVIVNEMKENVELNALNTGKFVETDVNEKENRYPRDHRIQDWPKNPVYVGQFMRLLIRWYGRYASEGLLSLPEPVDEATKAMFSNVVIYNAWGESGVGEIITPKS
ncbi:hypothetical protein CXG81DRAFT_28145 [Caulochytrium protostelioides]|uniref:SF3 helicase domain-containing protein n=1 Tax=Caulochytrium protostelioides TaxID=1555241 RepID=A0A4P9X240_9FUNG|nr:hypothetical protein CXG81DRAFT_28145 [Caulochytrium protostelioides]|eukprot:RKO99078.1 hypothetical protein CXG81DRAFT_28145 [Caulochytrium protostelioides]